MSVLFEPSAIKGLAFRNRFVRSATYDGCAEKNGRVSQKQLEMFGELARGGVGLIITGIAYVHPSGQISPFQNSLSGDDCTGKTVIAAGQRASHATNALMHFVSVLNIDAFVRSPKTLFSVIPAEAGIHSLRGLLDSRLRGSDGLGDFLRTHHS
jgi:hypothetical protein